MKLTHMLLLEVDTVSAILVLLDLELEVEEYVIDVGVIFIS